MFCRSISFQVVSSFEWVLVDPSFESVLIKAGVVCTVVAKARSIMILLSKTWAALCTKIEITSVGWVSDKDVAGGLFAEGSFGFLTLALV